MFDRLHPAVLLCAVALPLAAQETELPLRSRVQAALAEARPVLLRHLELTRGGMLALCCLAALHEGVPTDDAVFRGAIDRLSRANLESTYELSLRLMVMAEHPDFPDRQALAQRDTEILLQRQTTGGFGYRPNDGWWDLSNTQYATLGLRAAVSLGEEVPLQRWRLLFRAVSESQARDGGFGYRASSDTYSSMTVAGIAVLQICRQHLRLDPRTRMVLDDSIERAWAWMEENSRDIGNPRAKHSLYFHYGLERAAILSDREMVGEVDWYAAGAEMLLQRQLRGGGWRNEAEFRDDWLSPSNLAHPVDTAFAILFLRRGFRKDATTVPLTGARQARSALLPADALDDAVRAAATADQGQGLAILPALLACLRSDIVSRRRAATLAIYGITGEDFGLHPYRSPKDNAEAIKRAELWWLRRKVE